MLVGYMDFNAHFFINSFYSLIHFFQDQDPAAFGQGLIATSKEALRVRYLLLPYLYTLHYESFETGSTVARPLFFE